MDFFYSMFSSFISRTPGKYKTILSRMYVQNIYLNPEISDVLMGITEGTSVYVSSTILYHLELWNIDKTRLDHSNKVSISYEQANTFEMCDGIFKKPNLERFESNQNAVV